jgi:hypothetical protein
MVRPVEGAHGHDNLGAPRMQASKFERRFDRFGARITQKEPPHAGRHGCTKFVEVGGALIVMEEFRGN